MARVDKCNLALSFESVIQRAYLSCQSTTLCEVTRWWFRKCLSVSFLVVVLPYPGVKIGLLFASFL